VDALRNHRRRRASRLAAAGLLALAVLCSCTSPSSRLVTEDANRTTITVHVGQPLQVRLEPTTWRFAAPSEPSVLAQLPESRADGPSRCQVEFHCGHVSIDLVALRAGQATVTAYLTYCGEARWCDLSKVAFQVTIHVVP